MPSRKRERHEMDESVRKKLKTSAPDDTTLAQPMTPDREDGERAHVPLASPNAPSQDFQALQLLKGDFDDLRQLITCKICERLLYEPFVISCGHTYCYSCLCTWFATSRKKTCPNCREVITQPPAPSYVIKEMTNIFIRRHDHLPDGETSEQHEQWKFEETEIVRKDRNDADPHTGGLFKGLFRSRRRTRITPIHDPVDHVDRCPRCNWEIEDGMCNNCGVIMDSETDGSIDSDLDHEQIDDDFEDDDADADGSFGELDADFGQHWGPDFLDIPFGPNGRHLVPLPFGADPRDFRDFAEGFLDQDAAEDETDEEDDEDEDDEDDGSLDDFIDDRDANDITTYTISSQTEQPPRPRHRRIVASSDDEHVQERDDSSRVSENGAASDSESDGLRYNSWAASAAPVYEISDDEHNDSDEPRVIGTRTANRFRLPQRVHNMVPDSSEDEEPPVVSSRRRFARPTVLLDSDEEDDDDDDSEPGPEVQHDEETGRSSGSNSGREQRDSDEEVSSSVDEDEDDDLDEHGSFSGHGFEEEYRDESDGDENHGDEDHGDEDQGDEEPTENYGFSPMQSESEPEADMGSYDVYGQVSDGGDEGDWESET